MGPPRVPASCQLWEPGQVTGPNNLGGKRVFFCSVLRSSFFSLSLIYPGETVSGAQTGKVGRKQLGAGCGRCILIT